jgi:hypothetical protein
MKRYVYISVIGALGGFSWLAPNAASQNQPHWQTTVRWRESLAKLVPGTLVIDDGGIEFQSTKFRQRWAFIEIHTFDLTAQEFTLWTYQRRHWSEPGERPFHFALTEAMPLEAVARLSERVQKPVRNGIPLPSAQVLSEIPAHHRTRWGGSNGTLRLRDAGIDYVTEGRDSRSWRWADIVTLANPNPYELRVAAYREIVEFDLKQPLPRSLFERIWDRFYAADLNLTPAAEGGERQ